MTLKDLLRLAAAWLCARTDAHVRGWCPCPVCDLAEQGARPAYGMARRHPEFITRQPGPREWAWLSAVVIELWPAYEYASIITEYREGRS